MDALCFVVIILSNMVHFFRGNKNTYTFLSLLNSDTTLVVDILPPGGQGATSWWRHQMETFSALLAICAGNSPVPGEFPAQRPVTRSFDVFFDLRLNKRLIKQWWGWWFETLLCPLWRHRNVFYGCFYFSKTPLFYHLGRPCGQNSGSRANHQRQGVLSMIPIAWHREGTPLVGIDRKHLKSFAWRKVETLKKVWIFLQFSVYTNRYTYGFCLVLFCSVEG